MAQTQQLGKTATAVFTENGFITVVYHSTAVVKFNDDLIKLNTGGWSTATTKLRMNQASNQFALGYQVYQRSGQWFVEYAGRRCKFDRQAVLNRSSGDIDSDRLGESVEHLQENI